MHPKHFAVLLVLLTAGRLGATEAESGAATEPPSAEGSAGTPTYIRPTRESIYQHLATEMKAALGAEEHVRGAFEAVAGAMRDSVGLNVVPALQALVDGVVERAEDAWVEADDAGLSLQVKHCIDGAEGDAQQVAKRALEKIGGCIEAVDAEGQRRSREAARLLNAIEDVSKRFVLALESCIKEEEAKEATSSPSDPAPTPTVADPPAICPLAEDTASATPAADEEARTPCSEAAEKKTEGEPTADGKKPLCAKCKKAQEEKARAEAEAKAEAVSEEPVGKKGEKFKGKKGKEGKDKSGKWKKEDSSVLEESVEGKNKHEGKDKGKTKDKSGKIKVKDSPVSEESVEEKFTHEGKDKGKYKKGKYGESLDKTEKAGKKKKQSEYGENAAENSEEVKEKKVKKSSKKEEAKVKKGKNDEGEEKNVHRKRNLLSIDEGTDEALQAVLKRTSARQEEAPGCIAEHVRKAELKIAVIKQRMAACADRHMRQEL